MNYLKEILAFHYWLETNPLDATEQALWYHLMDINNRCGWLEWFAVANMTLQARLGGIDRKTLERKRNKLQQLGRIEYRNQGKREAGKYRLIRLEGVITGNNPLETSKNVPNNDLNLTTLNKQNINGVSNDTPDPPSEKQKKEQKPRKVKEPPSSDHQRVMGHYYTSFQEKFGVKPVIAGGKDGDLIKKLLAQKPVDEIIVLLDDFFNSQDSFIKNSGYTLGAFFSQVNKLATKRAIVPTRTTEDPRKKALIKKLYLT